jgi:prophage regulatory protein
MANSKLIRVKELAQNLSVSKATVWRWVALGKFPKPLRIGAGTTVWRVEDVDAFVAKQSEAA